MELPWVHYLLTTEVLKQQKEAYRGYLTLTAAQALVIWSRDETANSTELLCYK